MTYTTPIGINLAAWNEWVGFRKTEKKKPVSGAAARKQFKLLLKYSEIDQQRVIDNSIMNDYQGLFDVKPTYQPPQQSGMVMLTDTSWADGIVNQGGDNAKLIG
jgi:hypothetical protein